MKDTIEKFTMLKIIVQPCLLLIIALLLVLIADTAMAHNVAHADQSFLTENSGVSIIPFMYLGAKHMVTGYDHLLYLAGVIFFLFRIRDVAVFVSLFALGHSITLLTGVLAGWHVSPYLVDTVIGLSVSYKAFENLGGFKHLFSSWLDTRAAVFIFGLVHGLGLSTKLQDLEIAKDGLVTNILAFNVGVELGQLVALTFLLLAFSVLRESTQFRRHAVSVNVLLMAAGFTLMAYQFTGYLISTGS
ncbi:MAG: HupE/UreJ family protein [Porticoccaceae bacterium]|nr:HupE/UreJ family protein [Porticoccaceae bacterium]MBT6692244.1 HupE/UreJ family protein [Porticoccaceae bacterium]MBT7752810.1 HupE/UreJ family protein [Porticoccaceae bacterium]MBT7963833.1 HupE/UreJ family protein [Porticoccaceae bacterium]